MKRTINKLLLANGSVISHCSDDTMWSLSDDLSNWNKLPDIPQDEEELYQLSLQDTLPINLKDIVKVVSENAGYDKAYKDITLIIDYVGDNTVIYSYGEADLYYTNRTPHQVDKRDKDFEYILKYLKNKQ